MVQYVGVFRVDDERSYLNFLGDGAISDCDCLLYLLRGERMVSQDSYLKFLGTGGMLAGDCLERFFVDDHRAVDLWYVTWRLFRWPEITSVNGLAMRIAL